MPAAATEEELVSTWLIADPDPALAPEMPAPLAAVQLKVVPPTVLVKLTDVAAPEQIVDTAGVAVATGAGLTVMITGTEDPGHPLAVGTML